MLQSPLCAVPSILVANSLWGQRIDSIFQKVLIPLNVQEKERKKKKRLQKCYCFHSIRKNMKTRSITLFGNIFLEFNSWKLKAYVMGQKAHCNLARVCFVTTFKLYISRSFCVSFSRSGGILVTGTYLLFFFKAAFSCLDCTELLNQFVSEEQGLQNKINTTHKLEENLICCFI